MTIQQTTDIKTSYKNLRRLIGILGISLPFLCLLGLLITGTALQPSISHCYHTNVRDVFIGIMIGSSMFLITYKGYNRTDDMVTNLTGIFGTGLALCPCLVINGPIENVGYFNLNPYLSNVIHIICAGSFFGLLAFTSIFLFTRTDPEKSITAEKKKRNIIYIACGIVMIALMLLVVVLFIILGYDKFFSKPIAFVIETIMLFAFGISWLVKGETLFKDKERS